MNVWRWCGRKTATGQALAGFALILLPFFIAGCASDDRPEFSLEERRLASAPEPPPVLSVPVVALLTNQPAFGAHARFEMASAAGSGKPMEGELLHRADEFLLALQASDKRARGREMTYLWNDANNSGAALNDALPGYAPIPARPRITHLQSTGRSPAIEKINGHLCDQEQVTMSLSDGSERQFTVWRASDLHGFPVRIRCDGGAPRFTIEFHDIRFKEPAATLFDVPRDFTRYDTPKAMFDELFRRESATRRGHKPQREWDEESTQFQRPGPFQQY